MQISFFIMDDEERRIKTEEKIGKGLEDIRAEETSEIISASIVLGLFRKLDFKGAFSLGEIAQQTWDGKWFRSGEEEGFDYDSLRKTLGLLEKNNILFLYPDGKYVYRFFK